MIEDIILISLSGGWFILIGTWMERIVNFTKLRKEVGQKIDTIHP